MAYSMTLGKNIGKNMTVLQAWEGWLMPEPEPYRLEPQRHEDTKERQTYPFL